MKKTDISPAARKMGKRLTAQREALGLDKTLLARAIGVALSTVSLWEAGRRTYPAWAQRIVGLLVKSAEARRYYGIET